MSNLIDIQSQIQKLQKQEADIKAREFDTTVRDILAKMQAFGISIKDLQAAAVGGKTRGRPVGKGKVKVKVKVKAIAKPAGTGSKKKAVKTPVAAKFKGPNGETWSGRGLTPRWLATLVAQGQPKESFAIKG